MIFWHHVNSYEEGLKASLGREIGELRNQQTTISSSLEQIMDRVDNMQQEDHQDELWAYIACHLLSSLITQAFSFFLPSICLLLSSSLTASLYLPRFVLLNVPSLELDAFKQIIKVDCGLLWPVTMNTHLPIHQYWSERQWKRVWLSHAMPWTWWTAYNWLLLQPMILGPTVSLWILHTKFCYGSRLLHYLFKWENWNNG